MTRSTPTTFGCGGNWGPAGPPELDAAHAKSYKPNKGSYDVKHRTDGLARKGWFRKELEPCEWKLSCTVLRGKGFVRVWTTRCGFARYALRNVSQQRGYGSPDPSGGRPTG